MRFVFPTLVAVIIALLFIDFYSLSRPVREFDLPKPSRPNPLQVHTLTPAATLDMMSAPASAPAAQTESAVEVLAKVEPADQAPPEVPAKVEPTDQVALDGPAKVDPSGQAPSEVLTKIEPAARAARAQAAPIKKGIVSSKQRYRQNELWALDADSFMRYVFFGR